MEKLQIMEKEINCDFESASCEEILQDLDNLFDNLILE